MLKKMIFLTMTLAVAQAFGAGRLQNEDFKTLAQITAAGGTSANLLNDTKIYVTANGINAQLSAAITSGVIGSGKMKIQTAASVTSGGTITISTATADARQIVPVSGNSTFQTSSVTPFGTTGFTDGMEIILLGTSDSNTVTIPYNDASSGCVGNFDELEIGKFDVVKCVYSTGQLRFYCSKGAL